MSSQLYTSVFRGFRFSLLLVAFAALLPTTPAKAYPLNPWGGHSGYQVLAVTPFLYVYQGEAYPLVYAGYGITERVDIMAGIGGDILLGDNGGYAGTTLELFPRFFLTEQIAVVPHFYLSPGSDIVVAPELHMIGGSGSFTYTANLSIKPDFSLTGGGYLGTAGVLYFAPEYAINDTLSVFLEVDPIYDGGLTVQLVPGIGLALGNEGQHIFSIGLQLALASGEISPSVGAWYSYAFDLSGG